MEHEAKPTETKPTAEFGKPVTLYRIPCSCGWVGMWRNSSENAGKAFDRHVAGVTK